MRAHLHLLLHTHLSVSLIALLTVSVVIMLENDSSEYTSIIPIFTAFFLDLFKIATEICSFNYNY